MFPVLYMLAAAACWAAAAYRLRDLRRGAVTPAGLAVAGALAGVGTVMLLQVAHVTRAIDQVTTVPSSAQALGHAVGVASGLAAQLILVYVVTSSPTLAHRRARRRALVMGSIVAGIAAVFFFAPDPPLRDRLIQPTGSGVAYSILFTTSLAIGGTDVARLGWWGGRVTERPYLRLGLRLIASGGALTVVYAVAKNVLLGLRLAGRHEPPFLEQVTIGVLILVATMLFAIGATLPSWGPRVGLRRVVQWLSYYQDHRGLRPLWLDLYRAEPMISLEEEPNTSRWADVTRVRGLKARVYRRFVEIRDGLLLLRPWFDPDVDDVARRRGIAMGLDSEDLAVVTEASVVAVALAARAAGVAPTDPPRLQLTTHNDVDAETRWLRRVAAAYHGSPVVRAVLGEMTPCRATAGDVGAGSPA